MLLEIVGPELGRLDQELAKLALLSSSPSRQAGVAQITRQLVEQTVGGWGAKTAWSMIEAALDGNAAEALVQLDRLLLAGEEPIALLAMMSGSLRRLAAATRIIEQAEADAAAFLCPTRCAKPACRPKNSSSTKPNANCGKSRGTVPNTSSRGCSKPICAQRPKLFRPSGAAGFGRIDRAAFETSDSERNSRSIIASRIEPDSRKQGFAARSLTCAAGSKWQTFPVAEDCFQFIAVARFLAMRSPREISKAHPLERRFTQTSMDWCLGRIPMHLACHQCALRMRQRQGRVATGGAVV